MNRFISILFQKKVYDPFSIYQIYPIEIYKDKPIIYSLLFKFIEVYCVKLR